MLKAWSNREAFPAWREHGHRPALGEPWNGECVLGADTQLRTEPEVSLLSQPCVALAPQPHCPAHPTGFSSFPPFLLLTHHCSKAPQSLGLKLENKSREQHSAVPDNAPSPAAAPRCFPTDRRPGSQRFSRAGW